MGKNIDNYRDDIKIYIRHCGERTVPILQWYFHGYDIELVNGSGKKFTDVLRETLSKIPNQNQSYAIVADADMIPLIGIDQLISEMLCPFRNDNDLIAVNGTRIDKFLSHNGPNGFQNQFRNFVVPCITIRRFCHKEDYFFIWVHSHNFTQTLP